MCKRYRGAVGRLRRFYVKQSHRGYGVGARLLKRIEAFAFDHFSEIRLFTDTASAGRFYEKNGYQKAYEQGANYIKRKVT
ncbi:GNAT family N-acetyltransferase [Veronia nyctiphanis]|uniref:GNAT family N-acetyltransferase n=1 Tax=Veronia nyctiphanis TaxID=1278244 RepID=UPI00191C2147